MTHRPRHAGKGPSRSQQRISKPKPFVTKPATPKGTSRPGYSKDTSKSAKDFSKKYSSTKGSPKDDRQVTVQKLDKLIKKDIPSTKYDKPTGWHPGVGKDKSEGVTIGGPAGLGSPPPSKKIIPPKKEIEHEIPKDFKRKRKAFQAVSFFFPKIKASLGAPAMRFGGDWQKRNAQQHLMFTAMNPILATIHEFPGFAGFDAAERNQDLYNNALRDEVLNRAQEIDARKGKTGLTTPSTDAIEQASFNMVNEQSERMETGQEFSSTLPNIRPYQKYTNKKVPSLFSPMKSRLNEVALNISNKLMNWGQ